eukprot:m.84132 g.84132  ORF g.84132 m.84132 type:complete len:538 (+) comp14789_c1_seq1:181-1794(+)
MERSTCTRHAAGGCRLLAVVALAALLLDLAAGLPACSDQDGMCEEWASQGECAKNEDWMLRHCPKTCQPSSCDKWAAEGECEANAVWMLKHCPVSCKACSDDMRDPAVVPLADVALELKSRVGRIEIGLFAEDAPKTVAHIVDLARLGCYDTTDFFRVEPSYMIQVSEVTDARLKWCGQVPDIWKTVPAEFSNIKHVRGAVSLARYEHPDSGRSSFSFVLGDAPFLDREYTVFGRVLRGFDVLDKIAATKTNITDRNFSAPVERIEITSLGVANLVQPEKNPIKKPAPAPKKKHTSSSPAPSLMTQVWAKVDKLAMRAKAQLKQLPALIGLTWRDIVIAALVGAVGIAIYLGLTTPGVLGTTNRSNTKSTKQPSRLAAKRGTSAVQSGKKKQTKGGPTATASASKPATAAAPAPAPAPAPVASTKQPAAAEEAKGKKQSKQGDAKKTSEKKAKQTNGSDKTDSSSQKKKKKTEPQKGAAATPAPVPTPVTKAEKKKKKMEEAVAGWNMVPTKEMVEKRKQKLAAKRRQIEEDMIYDF